MVGIGNATKKLQTVIDAAEELYERMNELRAQVQALQEEVETTSRQVDDIEHELAKQRALLEAVADERGIDVETALTDAAIDDAESRAEAED